MRDGLNLQHNSTPATIQALGNSFRDGAPLFDFESSLTARSITAIRACRKGTGVLACWRGVADGLDRWYRNTQGSKVVWKKERGRER